MIIGAAGHPVFGRVDPGHLARWRGLLLGLGVFLGSLPALAHKTSDSYLRVRIEGTAIRGEWELALHDLEFAIGLDANEDGSITWGEVKAKRDAILDYAQFRLGIEVDGRRVPMRFETDLQIDQLANGAFVVLRFGGMAPTEPESVGIDYQVFFDLDRLHRGLALVEVGGQAQQAVFSPTETHLRFECHRTQPWREFGHFSWEGVWHIWMGYDHILFLVSLLLPAVLVRGADGWRGIEGLRGAFVNVVKVVTAFTVAHSITLSLATLDLVRLPSRWVESVIAASIVVAALNNVFPLVTHRTWGIAFGFGLIHGFGFASVLSDLGLPRGSLVRALFGFNLGVEAGQLAIVGLFLPAAFALRNRAFYRDVVLRWGSVLIALLATWWMIQRLRGG